MNSDIRLTFRGGIKIYQDGCKFDASATLYAEGSYPPSSFFGDFSGATPDGLRDGAAMIRFSDGSEADAVLAVVDPDGGGFRITEALKSSEEEARRAREERPS